MTAKPVDAVLADYLAGKRVDIQKTLKKLPADVDAVMAARVVVKLMERTFWLGRWCKQVPAPVIRAVLAADAPGPTHLFLRLAVPAELDDAALVAAWQRALGALLDLDTTYAWGSKQRRAKIVALARDPHVLPAIQGTVAHSEDVQLDMLAVLAADGSTASYDALVTHIGDACESRDHRVDLLAQLRTHATRTPALDALFAELDEALDDRNAASPALALGPVIGIGKVSTLFFGVALGSRQKNSNRVPWVQGSIHVDSRTTSWFRVAVSTVDPDGGGKSTRFGGTGDDLHDGLKLGRCQPAELPRWLAATAQKLEIEWEEHNVWNSNLRGAKRERILQWLAG